MTDSTQMSSDWSANIILAFRNLTIEDMPSLEILFLDQIAVWVLSDENSGHDYTEEHGGIVITKLFNAFEGSRGFRPAKLPVESEQVAAARKGVVAGAHEIAEADNGITLVITRLMPTTINELERNSGNPGAQLYWVYFYSLLAISSGTTGGISEPVGRGIAETFEAWEFLIADGFRLPWRTVPGTQGPGEAG